jgi:hypothetical protein
MTEFDRNRQDAQELLEAALRRASGRKLRLFAVAAARQLMALVPALANKSRRYAVDIAEAYADRNASQTAFAGIQAQMRQDGHADLHVRRLFEAVVGKVASTAAELAMIDFFLVAVNQPSARTEAIVAMQLSMLQEAFSDLMACHTLPPLPANVRKIAGAIYEERAFDRLPILADALEEAGCTDAEVLEHCRGPGPHVRGCWVVDLLLGKE